MLDVPLSVKVEEWRRKAADGTATIEEMKLAVEAIRHGRIAAQQRSTTSRAAKAPVDTAGLLDELDNL